MVRFTRGTINGGTPAVRGGLYVYTPHVASVSCGDVECPGNMVAADLARTFVPLVDTFMTEDAYRDAREDVPNATEDEIELIVTERAIIARNERVS